MYTVLPNRPRALCDGGKTVKCTLIKKSLVKQLEREMGEFEMKKQPTQAGNSSE